MSDQEDVSNSGRQSLKTLQHEASDQGNLVGRPSNILKHEINQEPPIEVEVKRKNLSIATRQRPVKISVEDLTNPEGASSTYWITLAENRQVALKDALDENERLHEIIGDLKEENFLIKEMLEDANSFVEVIKEELAIANEDTGIDVNDLSTADETLDNIDEDNFPTASNKTEASQ